MGKSYRAMNFVNLYFAGDSVFISSSQRQVRFDWKNPHNDDIHIHFQTKTPKGKLKDAVPGKHRIYFKGKK